MTLRVGFLGIEDLPAYRQIGEKFFPATDWDHGLVRLRGMLQKAPQGIFCVRENAEIVGYMTLWPLLSSVVPALEQATLKDDGIDGSSLATEESGPQPFWLMSAIAVRPTDKAVRREIIQLLLAHFHATRQRNAPCQIYAHAETPDGRRFCTRTGFRFVFPADKSLCVYP